MPSVLNPVGILNTFHSNSLTPLKISLLLCSHSAVEQGSAHLEFRRLDLRLSLLHLRRPILLPLRDVFHARVFSVQKVPHALLLQDPNESVRTRSKKVKVDTSRNLSCLVLVPASLKNGERP